MRMETPATLARSWVAHDRRHHTHIYIHIHTAGRTITSFEKDVLSHP